MGFLQPLALLGLAAASIPALLHLLQRRIPPTVVFPAVRYLTETERRHSRRLKLRNLLLLLLRMVLIALVVLALARPVARLPIGDVHGPSALAVVVDNSLSSGAVVGGRRTVDRLAEVARGAVDRARAGDRLWLVLADGVPRRVGRSEALLLLDSLTPLPLRLDLGEAVRAAARVVAGEPLPGEVLVVSDLQVSALTAGRAPSAPVVVATPPPLPENRAVDSVTLTPAVWAPNGTVVASLGGVGATPGEVRVDLSGTTVVRGLAAPGDQAALDVETPEPGWFTGRVVVGPDELRADDERYFAVRAAPPSPAQVGAGAGAFVTEAVNVLQGAGRVRRGGGTTLGDVVVGGPLILFPPADPAQLGGVNRALTARGVSVRFGPVVEGEWRPAGDVPGVTHAVVLRRHRLEGEGIQIAAVGAEPWIVREADVVVVGSRLDETWTSLPITAGFVPFVDALINRVAGRVAVRVPAVPGGTVRLPSGIAAYVGPSGRVPVAGERAIQAPTTRGVYFLLGAAGDTVGALEVNHDPRESQLRSADADMVRATFGRGADLVDGEAVPGVLFRTARRADLTGWFLLLALVVAAVEFAVSSVGGRRTEET